MLPLLILIIPCVLLTTVTLYTKINAPHSVPNADPDETSSSPVPLTTSTPLYYDDWYDALDNLRNHYSSYVPDHFGSSYAILYSTKLLSNDSVGNDWTVGIVHDISSIQSGDIIELDNITDSLSLWVHAIERDSIDDSESCTVTFEGMSVGDVESRKVTLVVGENNGRYTGNIAKWQFIIWVKRIS